MIVHGGAWDIPPNVHKDHLNGVENALTFGLDLLKNGGTALETVIKSVKMMEDDPIFDAGYGSFLNANGEVEMDAIVVNGQDLSFGAVASIQNIQNPVIIADLVRQKSDHALLVGPGATQFALNNGYHYVDTEKLLVGRELDRYYMLKKKKKIRTRQFFENPGSRDTVVAVAMDRNGNFAVATSTGGTPNKLPGRVGDSPLIGCGAYSDNQYGGASSTGWGESIMKVLLAKTTIDFLSEHCTVQQACEKAINFLTTRVDGRGGVICIDRQGHLGCAYNTPFMARAGGDQKGVHFIKIS